MSGYDQGENEGQDGLHEPVNRDDCDSVELSGPHSQRTGFGAGFTTQLDRRPTGRESQVLRGEPIPDPLDNRATCGCQCSSENSTEIGDWFLRDGERAAREGDRVSCVRIRRSRNSAMRSSGFLLGVPTSDDAGVAAGV